MRIILMRHGKPSFSSQKPVSSLEFKNWIDSYNAADICDSLKPHTDTIQLIQHCNAIICSNLQRSIDSAKFLGINNIYLIDSRLREMEMPWGKFSNVKLKPKYWSIIFRILWFLGYSKNSETFGDAKSRAKQASLLLESIAREKQSVLFIGHGVLNRFIAKYLIQHNWKAKKKIGSNYWQIGIFEYTE